MRKIWVPGLGYDFNFEQLCNHLKSDIVLADAYLLPFSPRLSAHQQATFYKYAQSKFIFHEACRGSAKSYTTGRFMLAYGLVNMLTGVCTAPTYRQALQTFNYAIGCIKENSTPRNVINIGKELDGRIVGGGNIEARMKFKNETVIKALPMGSGEKIRGERADILHCDEFYQMDKAMFKDHILPFLYKKVNKTNVPILGVVSERPESKLILTTSAEYEECFAYTFLINTMLPKMREEDFAVDIDPTYRRKYCVIDWTIDDLVECGFELDPDIVELQMSDATQEEKNRALYNKWSGSSGQFFPSNLQGRLETKEVSIEHYGEPGYSYALTADIAQVKGGDDFIIHVWKFLGNRKMALVNSYWDNGLESDEMALKIHEFHDRFPGVEYLYMDKGGGGLSVASSLNKRKLILSDHQEVEVRNPILIHDQIHMNGEKILILNRPTDEKVREAFSGETSKIAEYISSEDTLAHLTFDTLKKYVMRDDPAVLIPYEASEVQDDYARSEVEILDNIRESLHQLRHLKMVIKELPDGTKEIVRTQMGKVPKYVWRNARKDGAVTFCYGIVPYLLHYKEDRGIEPEGSTVIIEPQFYIEDSLLTMPGLPNPFNY